MGKVCKLSAIALLASSTSLMAQTFSGPYAGVSVSAAGIGIEASKTNITNTSSTGDGNGPVGAVFGLAAFDIGYGIPGGKGTTIAIGATYTPMDADFDGKSTDASTGKSHKFTIKNPFTVYVAPTFEINKDSAFFVKAFYSHADVKVTNVTSGPGDLEGYGGSTGLKVMLTPNAFIQMEAAVTRFDDISATVASSTQAQTGAATGALATSTRKYVANDPTLVEGRITLGYKF
jgi:hypothetical protein